MTAGNVQMLFVPDTLLSTCRIKEHKYNKEHYNVYTTTIPNSYMKKQRL